MLIEKDKFHFQSSYTGLWHREKFPDEQISGTLYVEDQKIWIELSCKHNVKLPDTIDSIVGCTYAIDETGKNISAKILANKLEYIKGCNHIKVLRYYKYAVSNIFLYKEDFKIDKIQSLQLRANILDKWASEIIAQSFVPVNFDKIPQNHHIIHFVEPNPYTLYRCSEFHVRLEFVSAINFTDLSRSIDVRTYIKVNFINKIPFQEALEKLNQILYLLYLLTNRIFSLDYIYLYNCNNEFVYKANEQQLSRYIEQYNNIEPFTSLSDFSKDEINSLFQKWHDFYSEYQFAIEEFFEIQTNIYSSPSTKIKNFISVIDALSKNLSGKESTIEEKTKNANFLNKIIDNYNISSNESNELRYRFLKISGHDLKNRFTNLINSIGKYLPSDWDSDFVVKVVNTRNNITHPKTISNPCYPIDCYNEVASQLNKIIICYILMKLGIKDDVIEKI